MHRSSPYWFGSRHGFTGVVQILQGNAQKRTEYPRKKNLPFWLFCWITPWTYCSDLLWYIDNRLVTLTNPRLRFPRDIFNIQTTHCSNGALANFVVAGPLLCAIEPPVSLYGRAWLQWHIFGVENAQNGVYRPSFSISRFSKQVSFSDEKMTEKMPKCSCFLREMVAWQSLDVSNVQPTSLTHINASVITMT